MQFLFGNKASDFSRIENLIRFIENNGEKNIVSCFF